MLVDRWLGGWCTELLGADMALGSYQVKLWYGVTAQGEPGVSIGGGPASGLSGWTRVCCYAWRMGCSPVQERASVGSSAREPWPLAVQPLFPLTRCCTAPTSAPASSSASSISSQNRRKEACTYV